MQNTWKKRTKKLLLTSVSTLLLASQLSPLAAFAEESNHDSEAIDSVIETEEVNEGESDSLIDEEEAEKTLEDNVDNESETGEEETSEPDLVEMRTFDTITEFVHKFDELTEEEIDHHIDEFKLYADDKKVLHSLDEAVQEEINANNTTSYDALINYLIQLREQNIEEVEVNEDEINSDLQEENSQDIQTFDMQTYSMNRSALLSVNRLEGANRYETAISISKNGWNRADTVIIVDSNQFADSLAGAPLAHALNAPILLTGKKSGENATLNEINRLGAKKAIILGGELAVSKSFENQMRNKGITIERIAGGNRYETAKLIGDRVISITGSKEAFLVSGEDFADAMSVAPFASKKGAPIYLTRKTRLVNEVVEATNKVKNWTIIGGFTAVDENVGGQLKDLSNRYSRVSGSNRYDTNRKVINKYRDKTSKAFVATGLNYMDALTGSVLAAKEGTSVILVRDQDKTLNETISFIKNRGLSRLSIFGGLTVLSERVESSLRNLEIPSENPVIYIDPGHGGTDPGASYGGIQEKNLNLPTAMYLKNELEKSGDYTVIMSRESEKSLSLANRSSDANAKKADILVSVHYNAMGGTQAGKARGIETFIYHPYYTTNHSHFNTKDKRINESLKLANAVHGSVISATGMRNRGVRGSNLHMVRVPNMPAIIIELGFLDNPTDRSIVVKSSYQQNAAKAIKRGIDSYFGN